MTGHHTSVTVFYGLDHPSHCHHNGHPLVDSHCLESQGTTFRPHRWPIRLWTLQSQGTFPTRSFSQVAVTVTARSTAPATALRHFARGPAPRPRGTAWRTSVPLGPLSRVLRPTRSEKIQFFQSPSQQVFCTGWDYSCPSAKSRRPTRWYFNTFCDRLANTKSFPHHATAKT